MAKITREEKKRVYNINTFLENEEIKYALFFNGTKSYLSKIGFEEDNIDIFENSIYAKSYNLTINIYMTTSKFGICITALDKHTFCYTSKRFDYVINFLKRFLKDYDNKKAQALSLAFEEELKKLFIENDIIPIDTEHKAFEKTAKIVFQNLFNLKINAKNLKAQLFVNNNLPEELRNKVIDLVSKYLHSYGIKPLIFISNSKTIFETSLMTHLKLQNVSLYDVLLEYAKSI